MALIAVSKMSYSTFAVPSLTAASASDTFAMPSGPGQRFAVYRNTNAATRTVTVDLNSTDDLDDYGRALADIAYTIGATTGELWVPLHDDMANSSGVITITCSDSAVGVTVGHIQIA